MSKKMFFITFFLLFILLTSAYAFATSVDELDKAENNFIAQAESKIREDDTSLNTSERLAKLDVFLESPAKIRSQKLLEIILKHPFIGIPLAYDNPVDGLNYLAENYSPLREFLLRPDASIAVNSMLEQSRLTEYPFIEETFLKTLLLRLNANPELSARAYVTTVNTPMGTPVQALVRGEELSAADKATMNSYMAANFPYATRISDPTTNYNCHSYAWHSNSTFNTYWINDPTAYMVDTSYIPTSSNARVTRVYYPYGGHSALRLAAHSTVISKWGAFGLYSHASGYCPYNSSGLSYWWLNTNLTIVSD